MRNSTVPFPVKRGDHSADTITQVSGVRAWAKHMAHLMSQQPVSLMDLTEEESGFREGKQ